MKVPGADYLDYWVIGLEFGTGSWTWGLVLVGLGGNGRLGLVTLYNTLHITHSPSHAHPLTLQFPPVPLAKTPPTPSSMRVGEPSRGTSFSSGRRGFNNDVDESTAMV